MKWRFSSISEARPHHGVTGRFRRGHSPCPPEAHVHSWQSLGAPAASGAGSQALPQQEADVKAKKAEHGGASWEGSLCPTQRETSDPWQGHTRVHMARTPAGVCLRARAHPHTRPTCRPTAAPHPQTHPSCRCGPRDTGSHTPGARAWLHRGGPQRPPSFPGSLGLGARPPANSPRATPRCASCPRGQARGSQQGCCSRGMGSCPSPSRHAHSAPRALYILVLHPGRFLLPASTDP